MRIYVSGPLTAPTREDTERNARTAIWVTGQLLKLGHTPYCPHLSLWFDDISRLHHGEEFTHDDYLAWDKEWIRACDALLYMRPSPGADEERAYAIQCGIPVFDGYRSVPREMPEMTLRREEYREREEDRPNHPAGVGDSAAEAADAEGRPESAEGRGEGDGEADQGDSGAVSG